MKSTVFASATLLALAGIAAWILVGPDSERVEPMTEDVWIGELVDWDCKQRDPEPACPVDSQTARFAIVIDGGIILRLDTDGSALAREAVMEARVGGNPAARVVGVRTGRLLEASEVRLLERESKPSV